MGSVQLDKSLDDLIAEKQTRRTRDRAPRPDASANRESGARRDFRHRSHVDHAHEPRSGPKTSYWQHDDRDGASGRPDDALLPPRGQRWERGQPVPAAVATRGSSGRYSSSQRQQEHGSGNPIVTSNDGWQEVAQDTPQNDSYGSRRSGGYGSREGQTGPQRRGSVFSRLRDDRGSYLGQQQWVDEQHPTRGRFGDGVGGRRQQQQQKYDPGEEEARPVRRYYDEHDHRDAPRGPHPRRFEPYSRGGGMRGGGISWHGGRPRGGLLQQRKWQHDLYDPDAAAGQPGKEENAANDDLQQQAEDNAEQEEQAEEPNGDAEAMNE